MVTFEEMFEEHMKDPEFRKEWDALAEEYQKESARIREEIESENLKNNVSKNSEKVA